MSTGEMARVHELAAAAHRPPGGEPTHRGHPLVLAVAAALACSPLAFGYYDLTTWAPLALGALVLLVMAVFGPFPVLTRYARAALLGFGLLLVLSFASILWAQSRDSAWTSANRLALYAVIFVIGLLGLRDRATTRIVMTILGLPGLLSALVLTVRFIVGDDGGLFLQGRLTEPMGYINGTAGLFVMGIWPWLAWAEAAPARWARAAALACACLIADAAVLTQSRAIVLASLVAVALALVAAPGRTRRGVNLLVVLLAAAATAHWTLAVYASTGPRQFLGPSVASVRAAGLALLAAAVVGFWLRVTVGALAARLSPERRARATAILGRGLLALVAVVVAVGGLAERHRITTQWHDFTALRAESSATNRFLALGGGYRYDLWRVAVDEFTSAPLGGVGAGSYSVEYYQRRHQLEDVTVPHSLELQMLADLGIGGAIGLALLLGGVLAAGLTRRYGTLAARDPAVRVAAIGMFGAWLAATSVDWLYDIPGLAGMAILAAAVLVAGPSRDVNARGLPAQPATSPGACGRRHRRGARLARVATIGLLALFAASLGRQYVAMLYRDSGQRLAAHQPVAALRALRTAEQLDPWSLSTQYAVATAYARLDEYAGARAALRRASELEPGNYVPPALLGDIATRAGDPTAALAAYRRALRLDPLEPALQQAVALARRAAR